MFWEPAPLAADASSAPGPLIADSRAAARVFAGERWPADREMLLVAHLDGSRRLLDVTRYESGAVDEVLVPVRAIVAACARRDSEALVLAHNHPSGALRPTRADIDATARLAGVLRALDIALFDHLIFVADGAHVSLRLMGLL